MNRKELLDMIGDGTAFVREFVARIDDAASITGSYADWRDRDVVGHIVGWMDYSIDKLSCIKLGTAQSDEYAGVASLDQINELLYQKTRAKPKEEMEGLYIRSLGAYITVVAMYSNDELNKDSFPIGFTMDLWRYMLMDTVIHPLQHVMYHYLKQGKTADLARLIQESADIFEKYSPGRTAFALSEFEIRQAACQQALANMKEQHGGNAAVMDFVRMNGQESPLLSSVI